MQMMAVLKPIAFDVVICMSQLFDYYLFAVSELFLKLLFSLIMYPLRKAVGIVIGTRGDNWEVPGLGPSLMLVCRCSLSKGWSVHVGLFGTW